MRHFFVATETFFSFLTKTKNTLHRIIMEVYKCLIDRVEVWKFSGDATQARRAATAVGCLSKYIKCG